MTELSLLHFMKRILEKGSEEKSEESLFQLRRILEDQKADKEMIKKNGYALGLEEKSKSGFFRR